MSDWRDPEMEADLAAERALPTASDEARAALYDRVLQTAAAPTGSVAVPAATAGPNLALVVALLAGVGGWLAYEGGGPGAGPPPAPAVPASASDSGAANRSAAPSAVEATPAPAARPRVAARPTPTARPTPQRAPTRAAATTPPVAPATPNPTEAMPAAPTPLDSTLAAEQALLEGARRALASDDTDRALAAIDRHGHHFTAGELVEERELLRVQALARAGRRDAALAHAARFRARFPRSLLLEALDVALGAPSPMPAGATRPAADARFEEN